VTRQRLDEALVAAGLFASRARARDAIRRGTVAVDGRTEEKPARMVGPEAGFTVTDPAQHYVSRAALKLRHGLDHFGLSPRDKVCVDLGASTGGFTQLLLERGAARVMAVDVGHDQLAPMLRADPRVAVHEGVNARSLTRNQVPETVGLIVSDLSFISLKLGLPPALDLSGAGTELVALIKPQFEVGREHLGKGGIVTARAQQQRVCTDIEAFLQARGWAVVGLTESPLTGGDGNREFLIAARKVASGMRLEG